ncbi:hypothetical protein SESBI_29443 [Sesbania bispinosa]|nr:hypothetical protein SESBI_29443 [Sesbania bispinosa]
MASSPPGDTEQKTQKALTSPATLVDDANQRLTIEGISSSTSSISGFSGVLICVFARN